MEEIRLQGLAKIEAQENLPEVPELVQRYLDMLDMRECMTDTEGKFFRIVIEQKSHNSHTDGTAYLNELRIEKRTGKSWSQLYTTGMMQYHNKIDNWDLYLLEPKILEESEDEIIYAFRTNAGNVKVYRFQSKSPESLVVFKVPFALINQL